MGNFSRDTFDRLKHYVGVRLQQGVPIVDADWNEAFDISKYELQAFLKWFVGNGVPRDNDGFRILPADKAENDFVIKGRADTADGPGRCLVEGWDVVIERDRRYTEQPLYDNEVLAEAWGVDKVPPLTSPDLDRTDTVYLDVWEREVDSADDPDLVNLDIGLETCVRLKREWVVRVAEAATELPTTPDGHVFYSLATLDRTADQAAIPADAITDLRRTGLAVLSKEITIKDGNVGIGTYTPRAKLDVQGDTNHDGKLDVHGATYLVGPLSVSGATTLTDRLTVTGGDASLGGALTVSGNVGIGTTEPSGGPGRTLHVKGEKDTRVRIEDPTQGWSWAAGWASEGDFSLIQEGVTGDRIYVKHDGNVGIGTTDPEATLDVRGTLKAKVTMMGLAFDVPQASVDFGDQVNLPPDNHTIEFWIKLLGIREEEYAQILAKHAPPSDRSPGIWCFPNKASLHWRYHPDIGGFKDLGPGGEGSQFRLGEWYHVAGVKQSNKLTIYINGEIVGMCTDVPEEMTAGPGSFRIGQTTRPADGYTYQSFNGQIAEVRIWNRARTAAEINNHMNIKLSGREDGLAGYWPCDDGDGDQVKDLTPKPHNGTRHGARWFQEFPAIMTITGYGNVGIGTTDPKAKLDVNGFTLGWNPCDKVFRTKEDPTRRDSDSKRAKEILKDKPNGTFFVAGPNKNHSNHCMFYWKGGDGEYYRGWIVASEIIPD